MVKAGRWLTDYHCRQNKLDLGKTNVLSTKTDSGSEKQRQTLKCLSSSLSQAELYSFAPGSSTSHPEQDRDRRAGATMAGAQELLSATPARSHIPPALARALSHGLQSCRKKNNLASAWALHWLRFLQELSTCSSVGSSRLP